MAHDWHMADKPTTRRNLFMFVEHMDALAAMCKRTGTPVVRLIRQAIAEFLERNK
jgi:hypothetical protein